MVENPSFSASWMRWSTRFTGLISPERPTSPAKQKSLLTGMSSLEDKIAATTAKSIAGSSTEIPPVTFKKTSLAPNRKPARFSKTARIMFNRLALYPVVLRCGVPYTAVLTKACISSIKGRMPSRVVAIAVPDNSSSLCEIKISEGLDTSRKPLPNIS